MGKLPGPKYMPRMCMWVPLADLHGFRACDWAPSWGHPGSAPISCLRRGLEVDPKRRWQSFFAQACLERLDTSYLRIVRILTLLKKWREIFTVRRVYNSNLKT